MYVKQLRRLLSVLIGMIILATACIAGAGTGAETLAATTPAQDLAAKPSPTPDDFGGGPIELPRDLPTDAEMEAIRFEVERNIAQLADAGAISMQAAEPVSFQFPLRAADNLSDYSFYGISGFMDHNPASGALLDYMCGRRSYDLSSGYDHQGTDYFTFPFPWYKMDYSQVEIIAAAAGTLVFKRDGQYDRQCAMTGAYSNAVVIRHADGTLAHYLHMKNGSVTTKGVGAAIAAGEYLGVVGSSGSSTGPHLHFEVRDADNRVVDPYEGPCNERPSMWAEQPPYYDSAVIAVHTATAPPYRPPCPQQETTNIEDTFDPEDEITFVTTYRDQRSGQTSTYRILEPDGTLHDSWTHASTRAHYSASYWYWKRTLDDDGAPPAGTWRFEVDFEGETYGTEFYIIGPSPRTITVTHPNGGEGWWPGTALPITWDGDRTGEVNVDLYADGVFQTHAITGTRDDGFAIWAAPAGLAPRRDYTVRVMDAALPVDYDDSDAPFTIAPIPEASFALSPDSGPQPLTVTFTDTSTSLIDSWRWDFGDGVTATVQNPVHTYTELGTYTVALGITGPTGSDIVTRTQAVTVTLPPLTADFSGTPVRGQAPLSVTFTDRTLGPPIYQRLWDFGDGETSVLRTPTHVYTQNGTYTVTLAVSTPDEEDQLVKPAYIRAADQWDVYLPLVLR